MQTKPSNTPQELSRFIDTDTMVSRIRERNRQSLLTMQAIVAMTGVVPEEFKQYEREILAEAHD